MIPRAAICTTLFTIFALFGWRVSAGVPCNGARLRFSEDYRYLIGSSSDFSAGAGWFARWSLNRASLAYEPSQELLSLDFDDSLQTAQGISPTVSTNFVFVSGRWGAGISLQSAGRLFYAVDRQLFLDEGAVELWLCSNVDATNTDDQVLFQYLAPSGDFLQLARSHEGGVLYAGGSVDGEWQSAYSDGPDVRAWTAGEWHHLVFNYSVSASNMALYIDGRRVAQSDRYRQPAAGGAVFSIGSGINSPAAAYSMDAFRISRRPLKPSEIATRANRQRAPEKNENWLSTDGLLAGTQIDFSFAPADASPCESAASRIFNGLPIVGAKPADTLLPSGSTQVDLSMTTPVPAACSWFIGTPRSFDEMIPFNEAVAGTNHHATIIGLDPNPNVVNTVYVRCSSDPDFLLELHYRVLSASNPPFPRKANLWGWNEWASNSDESSLSNRAKIDLWLGVAVPASEIVTLRQRNPAVRVLTSINAVESSAAPDDYYLRSVNGQKIEVWPGSFRLNLTRPEVAEWQADVAAQTLLDSGLMADGVFFDNFMTTQSWLKSDMFGVPVFVDADGDSVADDPTWLDASWREGVLRELDAFRNKMPHALVTGHLMNLGEAGIPELFNGVSIGFATADVIEQQQQFSDVLAVYQKWESDPRIPNITAIESSPVDQFAYGYGYSPWQAIPPATLEFARTLFSNFRFGLAFTLMGNGYFSHEFGDTWHGNAWWYDELDFNLGYPQGAAFRISADSAPEIRNLVADGNLDGTAPDAWRLVVGPECRASLSWPYDAGVNGGVCAQVEIAETSGTDWHVELAQENCSIVAGQKYDFSFWGRSSTERAVTINSQRLSGEQDCGLGGRVIFKPVWQQYTITFDARLTASDVKLQFLLGAALGDVWIDQVTLKRHPLDIYRRNFDFGTVLLNATKERQQVSVEAGFRRLRGAQAPAVQLIVDDSDPNNFATEGVWENRLADSGLWKANGPYYHSWKGALRLGTGGASAHWNLPIVQDGDYAIYAWWPAAPESGAWCSNARYELLVDGRVVQVVERDQTENGDQWHRLFSEKLTSSGLAQVRVSSESGQLVADAIYAESSARYNDGAEALQVTLEPMDGIILRRDPTLLAAPRILSIDFQNEQTSVSVAGLEVGRGYFLERSSAADFAGCGRIQFEPATSYGRINDPWPPLPKAAFYRIRN